MAQFPGKLTLGNLTDTGREPGVEAIKRKAADNDNIRRAAELIRLYGGQRLTWLAIAEKLNQSGFRAAKEGCSKLSKYSGSLIAIVLKV